MSLYGYETWTVTGAANNVNAFETKRVRKLLRISYTEHKSNEYVRNKITSLVGVVTGNCNVCQ